MNNKTILLVTIAFLAVSSFLMIGGIGIQAAPGIPIQLSIQLSNWLI